MKMMIPFPVIDVDVADPGVRRKFVRFITPDVGVLNMKVGGLGRPLAQDFHENDKISDHP